jgi:hypothetical protein
MADLYVTAGARLLTPADIVGGPAPFKPYMCIQLSNNSNQFRHPTGSTELKIRWRRASLLKEVAADMWGYHCVVVAEINATQATLLSPCPCSAQSDDRQSPPHFEDFGPDGFDITLDPVTKKMKGLFSIGAQDVVVTTAVNTTTGIPVITDGAATEALTVIPAVGDYLCMVGNHGAFVGVAAPTGDFRMAYCIAYEAGK